MHHIQRKILSKLLYAKELGYAQLRPTGVESNHFAYHLDQLLRAHFIGKEGRRYFLTPEGQSHADRVSHSDMAVRQQPHIVTSIHITNDVGQSVLYKHAFQPYMNLYGAPQGRLHYDETVTEAAMRELFEKTGLVDIALTHRGVAYIHATKDGKSISKIMAHIFTGSIVGTPALSPTSSNGVARWLKATRLSKAQCMPGYKEVRKLLAMPESFFFAEISEEMAR